MDRHRLRASVTGREPGSRPSIRRRVAAEGRSQQEPGDVVTESIAIASLDGAGGGPDRRSGRVPH